jgi:hypothetical protein
VEKRRHLSIPLDCGRGAAFQFGMSNLVRAGFCSCAGVELKDSGSMLVRLALRLASADVVVTDALTVLS